MKIGVFYGLGKDKWAQTEYYWEAAFAIFAAVVISIMGFALLRVSKMQAKWRVKLAAAMEDKPVTTGGKKKAFEVWCAKYAMFILPFITVLREALEAVIFIVCHNPTGKLFWVTKHSSSKMTKTSNPGG